MTSDDRGADAGDADPGDDRAARSDADRNPTDFRRAVRDGYDDLGDAYADQRRADDAPALDVFEDVLDRLESVDRLEGGARLLDAGCGNGDPFLVRAADTDGVVPVGLDFSREQVELAAQHAPVVQGDLTALPFADDSVDALVALHSTIHVPVEEHPTVYREFRRVLRDGATLLVTCGTAAWEGENPDWLDAGTTMKWSIPDPETALAAIADVGFAIERRERLDDSLGGTFLHVVARAEP